MIHSKKYYTEIAGIFGMTAIIIMRIENSNEFLKIVLASLYAVIGSLTPLCKAIFNISA